MFMVLRKSASGGIIAVLTDDSIDRDEEIIGSGFIHRAANEPNVLPMLYDHNNSMMNLIGGWTDKRVERSPDGNHTALVATPNFFKKDPTAQLMENKVKEALDMGLAVGVSIAARAIADKVSYVDIGGKKYKQYDDLELLNAVLVPTQSNRNALVRISKSYDVWATKKPAQDDKLKSAGANQMEDKTDGTTKASEANGVNKGADPSAAQAKVSGIDELLKGLEERILKGVDAKMAELQSKFDKAIKEELDKAAADRTLLRKSIQEGDQTASLNKDAEAAVKKSPVSILSKSDSEGL